VEGDHVFLPIRSLLKAFGAEVAWDQQTSSAIIKTAEKDYLVKMDLANLAVNLAEDKSIPLRMHDSSTYIPVQLLKEILNYEISWDSETRTLQAVKIPDATEVFKNLPEAPKFRVVETFTGVASWYGGKFSGRKTNSGEIFDENALTAAHRTLPFNTYLRVTFLKSQRSTIVRVNDRGPHVAGRVLDLSKRAAEEIGLKPHGLGEVQVEVLADYVETE